MKAYVTDCEPTADHPKMGEAKVPGEIPAAARFGFVFELPIHQ
jgi:hypothetical protein